MEESYVEKKSKLWILLVIALLLVAGGAAWYFLSGTKSNKDLLVHAVKSKTNGIKDSLTKSIGLGKDKVFNLNFDVLANNEKINFNSFVKNQEVYLKMGNGTENIEAYFKDDKLHYKMPEDDKFYYTKFDFNIEVSDDNVDDLFKDVKAEDVKKEDAEITVNGKDYRTTKLSYQFTEEQMKKIQSSQGTDSNSPFTGGEKLSIEAYLYKNEIIRLKTITNDEDENSSVVIDSVDGFLNVYMTMSGIKAGEFKAVETSEGKYNLSVVVMGQEYFKGTLVSNDKELTLNMASPDGSVRLDVKIDKISKTEFDANVSVVFEGERFELNGKYKEVDNMPNVDVSNSEPAGSSNEDIDLFRNLPINPTILNPSI